MMSLRNILLATLLVSTLNGEKHTLEHIDWSTGEAQDAKVLDALEDGEMRPHPCYPCGKQVSYLMIAIINLCIVILILLALIAYLLRSSKQPGASSQVQAKATSKIVVFKI